MTFSEMVGGYKFRKVKGPAKGKGENRVKYMQARAKRRKVTRSPGINVGFWNARSLVSVEKQEHLRQANYS